MQVYVGDLVDYYYLYIEFLQIKFSIPEVLL